MKHFNLYLRRVIQLIWAVTLFSWFFVLLSSMLFSELFKIGNSLYDWENNISLVNFQLMLAFPILGVAFLFVFPPWLNQVFIDRIGLRFLMQFLTIINFLYFVFWAVVICFLLLLSGFSIFLGLPMMTQLFLLKSGIPHSTEVTLLAYFLFFLNLVLLASWNTKDGDLIGRTCDRLFGLYKSYWPIEITTRETYFHKKIKALNNELG